MRDRQSRQPSNRLNLAHSVNHALNVVWISVGRDAMAKVKDVRPTRECFNDCAGFIDQILATCDHVARGQIALNAAVFLDMFRAPFRRHRIVQGDAVDAGFGVKADVPIARFARESDDGNARMAFFQLGGDPARRFDGVFFKRLTLEAPGPAVENLDDLGTGLDLHVEIFDRADRQQVDDLFKEVVIAFM